MHADPRLMVKIYRAIQDFPNTTSIDEQHCTRIANLISGSDFPVQIEALLEQYADRIPTMRAGDFVALLQEKVYDHIDNEDEDDEYDDARQTMVRAPQLMALIGIHANR
jgi:hypothetical protein